MHVPLARSPRGTRITYDALHYQWGKLCTTTGLTHANGIPRYTLHQLRHTHGSEPIEQGQHKDGVQRVLGHRDPRSIEGYADLHDDQVRVALEQGDMREMPIIQHTAYPRLQSHYPPADLIRLFTPTADERLFASRVTTGNTDPMRFLVLLKT